MKPFIRSVVVLLFMVPAALHARPVNEIRYDYDTDTLTLKLEQVYLIDVLQQLSSEIGFELDVENVTARRLVDFSGTGNSHDLVRRLVGSDSVVLSRYKNAPYRLKNVILLPDGDEDSNYLPDEPTESMPGIDSIPAEGMEESREP